MTLNTLIIWCRGKVPEADENVIPSSSSTLLDIKSILNEGVKEFCKITKCLPKEKKFNCTTGSYTYSISSNIPDFSEFREEGLWHYRSDTSTTTWDRLKPTTVRNLDQKFLTWRNQSNNDGIEYYWQDGDTIGVFYTPSTTLTNGFWAYYYANPSDMSSLTDQPFTGTSTQDPRLSAYEKYILSYYEHIALGILGYKNDSANKLVEFTQMCLKAKAELQSRRDIAQESKAKPKTIGNYGNPFK